MEAVFVKEGNNLNYFIFGINKSGECNGEYHLKEISTIKESSLKNSLDVKKIFFDEYLKKIEKEAFKGCRDLEIFGCCDFFEDEQTNENTNGERCGKIVNLKINETVNGEEESINIDNVNSKNSKGKAK
ncbi:MAG: hypothetical protein K5873_00055, partial [Treponema sp.]|nr:hypothetical protein [Treponema sp.]